MQVETHWSGDDFVEKVNAQVQQNLKKAGFFGVNELKKALNRGQPTKKVGGRLIGLAPSLPGEYPKKVTGKFQRSIVFITQGDVLTIGSNLDGYPKFLNYGTRKMAARPWMSLFFNSNVDFISNIILTGKP